MKGGGTEKDFIGFAVLSTTRFPLKGEVSNHKGIFDEKILERGELPLRLAPSMPHEHTAGASFCS